MEMDTPILSGADKTFAEARATLQSMREVLPARAGVVIDLLHDLG